MTFQPGDSCLTNHDGDWYGLKKGAEVTFLRYNSITPTVCLFEHEGKEYAYKTDYLIPRESSNYYEPEDWS